MKTFLAETEDAGLAPCRLAVSDGVDDRTGLPTGAENAKPEGAAKADLKRVIESPPEAQVLTGPPMREAKKKTMPRLLFLVAPVSFCLKST